MSVPFALSSAVAYGAGDFAGGLAARRTPVLTVTAVAQAAGLVALLPAALLVPGHISPPRSGSARWPGSAGMGGLLLYMRGLAVGPMGLVAPLSSVVGAGLPLVAGVLGGERPGAVGLARAGRRPRRDRAGQRRQPGRRRGRCRAGVRARRGRRVRAVLRRDRRSPRTAPGCGRWSPAGSSR